MTVSPEPQDKPEGKIRFVQQAFVLRARGR